MLFVGFCELFQVLSPLLKRRVPPRDERLLCGCNSIVQVVLAGNGDVPQLLPCSGVDTMVDLVRTTLLAVDNIVKLVKLERGNFSWRHICDLYCGSRGEGTDRLSFRLEVDLTSL